MYNASLAGAVPMFLYSPTYTTVKGVRKKTYPEEGTLFYGTFKTYGGTERDVNGVYSIEDTANIETWYRPDITSSCRIKVAENDAVYEIMNEPEDIELRHQYMRFKVKRVKGGV